MRSPSNLSLETVSRYESDWPFCLGMERAVWRKEDRGSWETRLPNGPVALGVFRISVCAQGGRRGCKSPILPACFGLRPPFR